MGFEGSPFQHCACRMPGKQCRKTPGARKEFPCFLKNRPCYGDLRPGRFPTPDSVRLCESLRLSSGLFPMDLFSPGVQDGVRISFVFSPPFGRRFRRRGKSCGAAGRAAEKNPSEKKGEGKRKRAKEEQRRFLRMQSPPLRGAGGNAQGRRRRDQTLISSVSEAVQEARRFSSGRTFSSRYSST